jgi:SAM-dependent methyltransferase
MRLLEIGPGDAPLEGFETLDAVANPGVILTHMARWGYEPLPLPDNTYDLIFASHVIEHIPWMNTERALKEVYRILKPGGVFECWTVDFEIVVKTYLEQKLPDDWDCHGMIYSPTDWCAARVFSYPKHGIEAMWHRALFDRSHLHFKLRLAGFTSIFDLDKTRGHDHGPVNLGVGAQK